MISLPIFLSSLFGVFCLGYGLGNELASRRVLQAWKVDSDRILNAWEASIKRIAKAHQEDMKEEGEAS